MNGAAILRLPQSKPYSTNYQDMDFHREWVEWATQDGIWLFLYAAAENPRVSIFAVPIILTLLIDDSDGRVPSRLN